MTGEAISDFIRFFAGFFDDRVSLYDKNLSYKGKIQVVVQLGRGPDGARLEAAVRQGDGFAIIRSAAIFKGQANRFG